MSKVAFHTLGCKVNQYETEAMKEQFRAKGFEVVGEEDFADVYIINTCTVTNLADRKSRQYIRRMKRVSPEALVAVTGCYSQVKPEELSAMEEVNIVTGNGEKGKLIEYVLKALEQKEREDITCVLPYDELRTYNDRGIITSMDTRTRAYIKIQEGCDRFCSYCMIPFARGHVRSRSPEEILLEAKALVDKGFKELVLTGINTALYGMEADFPFQLMEDEVGMRGIEIIIKRINSLEGDFRIRLSSMEPTVVDEVYVKRVLKYEKLCPHLHLSVQSGSNKIIKAMNRHYTREEYLGIVKALRSFDEGYGITTDIIVGFPTEEDEDFQDSLDLIKEVGFSKVHIFKYSKRTGTKAAKMKGQVSDSLKADRSKEMSKVSIESANAFLDSLKGQIRTVLFEEIKEGVISGYSENYIKVYCSIEDENSGLLNSLVKVRLLEIYEDGMKGEIVNE